MAKKRKFEKEEEEYEEKELRGKKLEDIAGGEIYFEIDPDGTTTGRMTAGDAVEVITGLMKAGSSGGDLFGKK